jgi:hypothetical protein
MGRRIYIGTASTPAAATVDTAGEGYFIGVGISHSVSATNVAVSSANQTRAFQFVLPFRAKVTNIIAEVLGAGAAGKKFGVGLYDKDKNLILKTVALDANSATVQSDTLATPVVLEPSIYWLAQTCDDAATTFRSITVASIFDLNNENTVRCGTANASSAGVLPATLGTITASTSRNPIIVVFEP